MTDREYLQKYLKKENVDEELRRVKEGEAIQYVVGHVDFYGLPFFVSRSVLIPRWETEELVERTLKILKKNFNKPTILDIGTGSGCIAITLSKKIDCTIDAVDISKEALEVAKKNNQLNQANVTFIESDIFSNVHKKYDCIISNPPYIAYGEEIMDVVKNNEPHLALYAKDDGLYFYKQILRHAKKYLREEFLIAFEIGAEEEREVVALAKDLFPTSNVWSEKDLNGFFRYVFILKKDFL